MTSPTELLALGKRVLSVETQRNILFLSNPLLQIRSVVGLISTLKVHAARREHQLELMRRSPAPRPPPSKKPSR